MLGCHRSGGVALTDHASPLTIAWSGWMTQLLPFWWKTAPWLSCRRVMAYSSPPEVNFVAASHARSVITREWVFLWSCQVLWIMRANSPWSCCGL